MCWECDYMEDEFETCDNADSINFGKTVRDGFIYFKEKEAQCKTTRKSRLV